ncbi:hypothetical protein [Amycolatopsis sp. DG1A-15b]|uniref:hypothetical protein n=1 Tax=Amycolatopsis sp. DG1A-15b TaxID=3052846 RepID=UPI00255B6B5E|nr:hypothetical protein [Amycolatopsis sp. DG1A-15b]WIX91496.1 hypothetical protein QRY02_14115 [Amycolatopsis sp. DG1A-15b]
MTTSVDLSYPGSPKSPAALILDLVKEAWEKLHHTFELAHLRELLRGEYTPPPRPDFSGGAGSPAHNHLAVNSGIAVQAGAIHGDVSIYPASDAPPRYDVPIIVSISYRALPARGVTDGFRSPRPGAADDDIGIVVLVEGRTAQAVVLLAVRPVVVGFHEGLETHYSSITPHEFAIDLEPPPPSPPRVVAHGEDFPFAVTAGAPELFHFTLSVRPSCGVSWRLELDWTSAGRTGTVSIPRSGTFRIPSG